ncbi:similar to Saccharomyces cerevisiae YNL265C IST1 Protein with a positive role in the multivesicular body sorting pathway [Maudiozyma barnettii]|uniref:Similar to Saccharomyces cerevisiae YNL265C IST1 Protein with a positive role in the multivesicular body sorting pathway n=1 Tax=Maudiozyma barnettii TaxID=61262 RepID=A0A8H2VE71_9SACH|nr:Ist1p [Kazachstania barnettii]CAB4253954.1 similar to Saccharomyces cerevisiae YNL265C IST1 Protein with a positive role in the multivesicular body sorting pathway [Kazachstania barnettii]CAD1781704.1 similar to Saccharomyces cerevisiae YNL265C IST1 Protein with a positive role in the multivesicular body sorting pathway [Kazachstania barnettii]
MPPNQIPYQVKLKTCLRMCIQYLRYAQDKQQALAKQYRRDVAQLLMASKEQKAHYRVETLINDDIHVELLEILELYCELLLARVSILTSIKDEVDLLTNHIEDGINEAVRALVYASLHASEVKELGQLRDLLTFKFGQDFLKVILEEKVGVPDKVLKKCSPNLPPEDLVVLYLKEISRTYDTPYSQLTDDEEEEEDESVVDSEKTDDINGDNEDQTDDENGNNGNSVPKKNQSISKQDDKKAIVAIDNDAALDENDEHTPITVRKPRQNSETMKKDLIIPKEIKKDVKIVHQKKKLDNKNEDTELEDLKKRFAALRR